MKRAAVPSILVAVVLLALGVLAEAQQANKVPQIGDLLPGDAASESSRSEAIRLALWELGLRRRSKHRLLGSTRSGQFQGSIRRAKPGVSEWTLCNRRPANSFQRKTNRELCDQR